MIFLKKPFLNENEPSVILIDSIRYASMIRGSVAYVHSVQAVIISLIQKIIALSVLHVFG